MKPNIRPVEGAPVSAKVETITPQMAQSILGNSANNRNVNSNVVARYAAAMRKGQWNVGQPITLDHVGRLIDGQHRLSAVVQVGQPCDFLVVRGVHTSAFDVFDIGRKRSASDVLQILGFENYTSLASAARLVLLYECGASTHPGAAGGNSAALTVQDVVERAKRDERIREVVKLVNGKYRAAATLMRSAGMAACLLYLFEVADVDDAHSFFVALTGKSIENTEHPAWMLKMRLSDHLGKRKLNQSEISGLTVKAWNLFHLRRGAKLLKYSLFVESVPKISGYPYPVEG